MLSYQTPARLLRDNETGAAHLAKVNAEKHTGTDRALSSAQSKDFADALAARKAG